ncbi:MAG: alanine racemase [Caulobacteraceae bacterium]|nr:alanine racemase [Caulobacteraceae bacterium]
MANPDRPSRRLALTGLGGLALIGAGVLVARRPDRGQGGHDAYFQGLAKALTEAKLVQPTLVIDRARLDHNIAAVRQTLAGTPLGVRVVVKSLPSMPLIEAVADGLNTDRFMVFNGEMLGEMRRRRPGADILMGKPLPAAAAAAFYDAFPAGPGAPQPQWLIDSAERLAHYGAIAKARGLAMRVNFELDVGLHRGGFASLDDLAHAVEAAKALPGIEISGLMGYDPHVPKTPDPKGAFARAQAIYADAIDVLKHRLGGDPARLTLNTAGSPTYALHAKGTVANEVSIGSAFVKPADFDLNTLTNHVPAAFIATPVIKALPQMRVPSLEALSGVIRFFDPNTQRAFFIWGGHWMAKPVSPPGLQFNGLYGRSSNQELLTGSARVRLAEDDYVFFRPAQSEAVFLQFGDLALYDQGRITARWPTFPVSA